MEQGRIDFALAQFTVTNSRSTAVDFLPSISEGYQQIFLSNPADGLNWKAFIDPYTLHCWIAIVIFISVVPLVLSAIMFYGNNSPLFVKLGCKLEQHCIITFYAYNRILRKCDNYIRFASLQVMIHVVASIPYSVATTMFQKHY